MLSTPPTGGRLFVEPLEQRIAPTSLTALANHPQDAGDFKYVTYTTPPAPGKLGFVPASSYGVNGPSNLYAIALSGDGGTAIGVNGLPVSTGDQLQIFTADGYRTFLQAPNGLVIGFFLDSNNDNQVQNTELVGLSMGKKAAANVNGNVNGDIVTNLAKDGTLMLNNPGNFKQSITGLNVSGNIFGNIISGGDISNVAVNGNVNGIFAGTAATGLTYHFSGPGVDTASLGAPAPGDLQVGASLNNISLLSITDSIRAGDGGAGGKGGSVTQLVIQGDSNGFNIFSGNGGGGGEGLRGGAGGDISNVLVKGVPDVTPNNQILLQAGHGGPNGVGKGGLGGSISGVATSFATFDTGTNSGVQSADFLADNIVLHAGNGGNGLRGGQGGSVSSSQILGIIPDDGAVNADGSSHAEIQILGGNGGINAQSGDRAKGGAGGSINQVTAQNLSSLDNAQTSSILFQAGDGGITQAGGKGKGGGNVTSVNLLGARLTVNAGNGAGGTGSGGAGGNLDGVNVLDLLGILAHEVTLNAGSGGASDVTGGAGGNINQVRAIDSDLTSFIINSGTHANGGVGGGGAGGVGGSVTDVQFSDSGPFRAAAAPVTVRSGQGGDGFAGAGAGGTVDAFQLIGSDFSFNVLGGNGGNVLAGGTGRGGAGGSLTTVGISNQPADTTNALFAAGTNGTLIAGAGGNGQGRAGAGGDIASSNLRVTFDVNMTAGLGGSSGGRRVGAGGSITASAGSSLLGSVTAKAGDAGGAGVSGAAGGDVNGFIASASVNVNIAAGNSGLGGAGGNVANSGTTFDTLNAQPATGSLVVRAGNGSSGNGVGGAGGSITVFNGLVGGSGATSFTAGTGGGGDVSVAGVGGSIDQVKLVGAGAGNFTPTTVTFDAGDAGDTTQANRGVAGGGVSNVTLFNLANGTVVQHLAAGAGGDAVRRGGAGGAINEIHVGLAGETTADIGIRSGVAYGYQAGGAGGLFSGLGGTGARSAGAAGDVTNVTATAIASIAGGRGPGPGLAGTVNNVFLNGLTATAANGAGAFTNFDVANLVGSIVNPTAPGASTYQPSSGLIAAAVLGNDRNFVPEALLTLDGSTLVLVDYRQPNPSPSITPV
jgi:hypothetical protein